MPRMTTTPAEALAQALRAAGFGAGATENHLAVLVVNPDTSGSVTIWLPDDQLNEYIWGPSFDHALSGQVSTDELVETIKRTADHW